jgi:hypothetical protein
MNNKENLCGLKLSDPDVSMLLPESIKPNYFIAVVDFKCKS